MPGFDGTGPRGMGPMTGGGRGFCAGPWAVPWPRYTRMGAYPPYGVPWGIPYYGTRPFASDEMPFAPQMAREQELDFLQAQARAMREQLEQIEVRIQQLGSKA